MAAMFTIFFVEFVSTRYLARVDRDAVASNRAATGAVKPEGAPRSQSSDPQHHGHHHFEPLPPMHTGEMMAPVKHSQALGVLMLEMGIIFHSVFIGLTLAVSSGSDFISLSSPLIHS